MDDFIDSPIFGKSRIPTEAEKKELSRIVINLPVAVFQALNIALNARKLCLLIQALPEEES
jgi:hypothetical protein